MPAELIAMLPLVHAAATWFMVGLIWFVQVVHYPLMARVPADCSCAYALAHQRQTTWVVAPMMLIEMAAAVAMFWMPDGAFHPTPLRCVGFTLLVIVWISTATLQVPQHAKLAKGFDLAACRSLVVTNWIRTIAWSARGVVALLMLR